MRKFFKMLSGGTTPPDVIGFLKQYSTDIKILVQHYKKTQIHRVSVNANFVKWEYEGQVSDYFEIIVHVDEEMFKIRIEEKDFSTSEIDFNNIKSLVEAGIKAKYRSE